MEANILINFQCDHKYNLIPEMLILNSFLMCLMFDVFHKDLQSFLCLILPLNFLYFFLQDPRNNLLIQFIFKT